MRNDELPSILLAAGTLILVLLGSLAIASTYVGGDDEPLEASVAVQRGPECQLPDECRVASAELRRAFNNPDACDGAGARVCLVPMGDVSKELIDAIVSHYRRQYGLVVTVARPLDLREGFDRGTQLQESLVHSYLNDAYRKYATDYSVTLIGILRVDLFLVGQPASESGFGRLRGEPKAGGGIDYRGGIISTFSMDPRNSGAPGDTKLRDERLLKLLSKYIAHAHYDLPVSNDPTSVTYFSVNSIAALDRVNERIPGR